MYTIQELKAIENEAKFYRWLLDGHTTVTQLREFVKINLPDTAEAKFQEIMHRILGDFQFAEQLLGLDKPFVDLSETFGWHLLPEWDDAS